MEDQKFEHIYISKQTPVLEKIRKQMMVSLFDLIKNIISQIDFKNLTLNAIDKLIFEKIKALWNSIKLKSLFFKHETEITYFVIDHILLMFSDIVSADSDKRSPETIKTLFRPLFKIFPNYALIHELTALSKEKGKLKQNIVFDLIEEIEISKKERFHIISELSSHFPRSAVKLAYRLVETGLLETGHIKTLREKMINNAVEEDENDGSLPSVDEIKKMFFAKL